MARPAPVLDSFIWGAGGEAMTPEQIARQREIAAALSQQGVDTSPVGSWTQGAARVANALAGVMKERRADKAEGVNTTANSSILQSLLSGGASGFPAAPSGGAFPSAPGSSAASGASGGTADYGGDQLAWSDAAPYQKALLNTIAGPESGGRYNVIYGGSKFDDFSRHPGKAVRIQTGPNAGRTSSAAGKYQFLGSTYEDQAKKLGLTDFSPVSQDKAAWNLAAETYKSKTGQDLDAVLQSGDPAAIAQVGKVLNPIWTSLPGGIEQGTNTDRFVSTYQRALGAGATPAQATQVAQQETQKPVQVASLDPAAGMAPAPDPLTAMAPGTTASAYDPSGLPPLDPNDPMAPAAAPLPNPGPGEPAVQTPAGQRVLAAMMNPQPMGGAPMAMQGAPPQLQQPVSDPQQQVAQNLPVMAGGTADAIPAGQAQQGINPAIIEALSNPAASEQTRKIAGMLLGQQMESQDPLRQLQIKAAQKSLEAQPKQWQKLDDDTLFDPVSGETKQIGGAGGPTKFAGTGLEAQAWNILQSADPASREYATAYSIVSQPKTQLVQTENGMMPVEVPPQLPAWLTPPGGARAAPDAMPGAAIPAPSPTAAQPGAAGGVIPGTKKPQTEMQARNGAIGHILLNEVSTLGKTFGALADPKGQFLNAIPGGIGNAWQSEEYQRAAASVKTSIANVLYSLSGASSNPGEVVKQIEVLTPAFGDKPGTITDKLNRFKTYVRSVSSEANDPELTKMVNDALAQMEGTAGGGGGDKKKTSSGVEWSVEP